MNDQQKRTIIYARVSSDSQEAEGTSLVTQLEACLKYALDNGMTVVDRVKDTASGFSLDRPGIEKVRAMVRDREVDVVLAYAVDRTSRETFDVGTLYKEMERVDVALRFVTEEFTETAVGKLLMNVSAFVAESEREKISERTMRGKVATARAGRIPQATGIGLYGYDLVIGEGRREVNKAETKAVPSKSGKRWYPLTIRRILVNEAYTGRTVYRTKSGEKGSTAVEEIEIAGATPVIISKETFAQAMAIMDDPKRKQRGAAHHTYKLTGRTRCALCNTPMVGQSLQRGRYLYYRCRRSYSGGYEGVCNAKYIRCEVLEQVVLDEIVKLLADPRRIVAEAKRHLSNSADEAELEEVQNELSNVRAKQQKLTEAFLSGVLPDDALNAAADPKRAP